MRLEVMCPICEDSEIIIEAEIDPGERMITSGPSDGWYPGSPPGIAGFDSVDYTCSCRENLKHMFSFEESSQKQVVAVYDATIDELADEAFANVVTDEVY